MSGAKDPLPFDVLDLDGLRDDFAAGRVRQVGVVARRLLATLDAVLSSQGMVRASIESAHATALAAARAEAKGLREALSECLSWMRCECGHPACKRCPATKEADAALANGGAR